MDGAVIRHRGLAEGSRWQEMPFAEQMANVGSEVYRAGSWETKGRDDRAKAASDRALELLDFTVDASLRSGKDVRELLRLRELLCDHFYGDNRFGSTPESLNRFFDPFSRKAARLREARYSK